MRQFTYLLEVQKSDGTWGRLVDAHTGLTGFLDVVFAPDTSDEVLNGELHRVAQELMKNELTKGSGGTKLNRRVLFFPGDRREVTDRRTFSDGSVGSVIRPNPKLTIDEVYAIVEEGSDAAALGRRQFTWALQQAVGKDPKSPDWRTCRAGARGESILTGNVSLQPGFTKRDWLDAGPVLLRQVLSKSGAPKGPFYRLVIWEGKLSDAELDMDRSTTQIYDI